MKPLSIDGHLFQARMWREYAQAWDGRPTSNGIGRRWVQYVLGISREDCLRIARDNIEAARMKIKHKQLPAKGA